MFEYNPTVSFYGTSKLFLCDLEPLILMYSDDPVDKIHLNCFPGYGWQW